MYVTVHRTDFSVVSDALIRAGASPDTVDHSGVSVLYPAAAGGHVDVVRYLLDLGVNPSRQTNYGWAPLHCAASDGHLDCVRLLIDAGADPSPMSDTSKTPLDMALNNQRDLVIKVLVSAGAKTGEEVHRTTTTSYDEDEESEHDGSYNSELIDDGDIEELIETASEVVADLEQNTTLTAIVKKKVLQFLMRDLVDLFIDFNEIQDRENAEKESVQFTTTAKDLWSGAITRWKEMAFVQEMLSDEP